MNIMIRKKHKLIVCTILLALLSWGMPNKCIAQTTKSGITITVKNEPVEKILKRISHNADFHFFYDPSVIHKAVPVTINVKNASLQKVLDIISAQTGLSFNRTDNTISVSWKIENRQSDKKVQQRKNLTGNVKDNHGEPVIGASIRVKDSGNGTITDYNGNFTLTDVPDKGTLIVSYIGYNAEEIAITNKNNLQIVMKENAELLDEVVVVAYGLSLIHI